MFRRIYHAVAVRYNRQLLESRYRKIASNEEKIAALQGRPARSLPEILDLPRIA